MNTHPPILFSFDFLSLSFVSVIDPTNHIMLDSPTEGVYRVIKNGAQLRRFFACIKSHNLSPICYSNKRSAQTASILNVINGDINWIYIESNKSNYVHLFPNRAKLTKQQNSKLVIQYGQGFSACEGKEELRIAVCSALEMSLQQSKFRMVIYENNRQELTKLQQNGYQYIFSEIPNSQQELSAFSSLISQITKQYTQNNYNKQFHQFIASAPTLQNSPFIHSIHNFHYLSNTKYITLSSGLNLANAPPAYRNPHSMSVCSLVFRYEGDKQIYFGTSDMPSKIGGDLYHTEQQNKTLLSCIHQTLLNKNSTPPNYNSGYLCLPTYLAQFNMRHSLVQAYNKTKAMFIVRPYVKGLLTIAEMVESEDRNKQIEQIWKWGKLGNNEIKGLGRIIAISLLCKEELQTKGLLELVSIYKNSQTVSKQEKQQNTLIYFNCFRVGIGPCFKNKKETAIAGLETLQLNLDASNTKHKIKDMYSEYLRELKQTLVEIYQALPLIQSIFSHWIWQFPKDNQFKQFRELLYHYMQIFGMKNTLHDIDKEQHIIINKMDKINPRYLNYLIAGSFQQNFQYFTKIGNKQINEINQNDESLFQQKINSNQNFIIYGQCPPIYSLMRWINKLNPNIQITYLSFLHNSKQNYEKKLKLAKMQKKYPLFIVDHCEIVETGNELQQGHSITELNWGIRTIFVYRLKMGSSSQLKVLYDPLTRGGGMLGVSCGTILDSRQQLFKVIFEYLPKRSIEGCLFVAYQKAISMYIRNKWQTLGIRIGICDEEIIKDKLKKLVTFIAMKNNRLATILKDKEFNNFQLNYQQNGQSFALNTLKQLTLQPNISKKTSQHPNQPSTNHPPNPPLQHLITIPKSQLLLYCLPIHIVSQRVELLHDIYPYLNAFYLYQQIMRQTWNGSLIGEQLSHFYHWYPYLNDQYDKRQQLVKDKLVKLLDNFAIVKENSKSSEVHLMGSANAFDNCLELMRKIGIKLFCKLNGIFHFDSQIQKLQQIQHTVIISTAKGSIYQIINQKQENRQTDKIHQLCQGNEQQKQDQDSQQVCIGIYRLDKQVIASFITASNKNKIIIDKEMWMAIKQISISMQDSKIVNIRVDMRKLLEICQSRELAICKVERLGVDLFLMFTIDGQAIASKMKIVKQISLSMFEAIWEQTKVITNLFEIIKQCKQNQQLLVEQLGFDACQIKIDYKVTESSGQQTIAIVLKAKTTKLENQKENTLYFVLLTLFQDERSKIGSKILNKGVVVNIYLIKQFGLKLLSEKDQFLIQIMAFQTVTNALCIWQIPPPQYQPTAQNGTPSPPIFSKPNHRYYNVENEPADIYRIGKMMYITSRYGFMKRVILDEFLECEQNSQK